MQDGVRDTLFSSFWIYYSVSFVMRISRSCLRFVMIIPTISRPIDGLMSLSFFGGFGGHDGIMMDWDLHGK